MKLELIKAQTVVNDGKSGLKAPFKASSLLTSKVNTMKRQAKYQSVESGLHEGGVTSSIVIDTPTKAKFKLEPTSPTAMVKSPSQIMHGDQIKSANKEYSQSGSTNHPLSQTVRINGFRRQSMDHMQRANRFDLKIPRFLKVTNRVEDNDLDMVKQKLRKNMIHHMNFDPSYENTEGRRYFAGVYVPNQPEEVVITDDFDVNKLDDRDAYLGIHLQIQRGFNNVMAKGTQITSLRTGYDPKKLRLKFEKMKKEHRFKECRQLLKEIQGTSLYSSFLEKFQQEGADLSKGVFKDVEERKKFEAQMQLTLRKFLPNNFTGSFTVMRQKIEKMVDDGYTFQQQSPSQVQLQQQEQTRVLKSPLEIRFEEREKLRQEQELAQLMKKATAPPPPPKGAKLKDEEKSSSSPTPMQKFLPASRLSDEEIDEIRSQEAKNMESHSSVSKGQRTVINSDMKHYLQEDESIVGEMVEARKGAGRVHLREIMQNKQGNSTSPDQKLAQENTINGKQRSIGKGGKTKISPRQGLGVKMMQSPRSSGRQSSGGAEQIPPTSPFNILGNTLDSNGYKQLYEFKEEPLANQKNFIQKNIENLKKCKQVERRPWSVQQKQFFNQRRGVVLGKGRRPNSIAEQVRPGAAYRFTAPQTPMNFSGQQVIEFGTMSPKSSNLTPFLSQPQHVTSQEEYNPSQLNVPHGKGGRRVVSSALGSMRSSTRAGTSYIHSPTPAPIGLGMSTITSGFEMVKRSRGENNQSKYIDQMTGGSCSIKNGRSNRDFITKIETLSHIINKCEGEDIGWVKNTEANRQKHLTSTTKTEEEMRQAIDNYLDLMKIGVKEVPKITDIIDLQRQIYSYDFENFLSPQTLTHYKDLNFKQSVSMIKDMAKRKIWQPDKFHITKKSDVVDIPPSLGGGGK